MNFLARFLKALFGGNKKEVIELQEQVEAVKKEKEALLLNMKIIDSRIKQQNVAKVEVIDDNTQKIIYDDNSEETLRITELHTLDGNKRAYVQSNKINVSIDTSDLNYDPNEWVYLLYNTHLIDTLETGGSYGALVANNSTRSIYNQCWKENGQPDIVTVEMFNNFLANHLDIAEKLNAGSYGTKFVIAVRVRDKDKAYYNNAGELVVSPSKK